MQQQSRNRGSTAVQSDITIPRTKHSAQSSRFEQVVRRCEPGVMPRLSDIDYSTIRDLVPWLTVVDPDRSALSLKFARAGAGIAKLVGSDTLGFDYLDLVDPAIKGDAFDRGAN